MELAGRVLRAEQRLRHQRPRSQADPRPAAGIRQFLPGRELVDAAALSALDAEAEAQAGDLRQRMNTDTVLDPADLFRFVYAEPTPALRREQQQLAAELEEPTDEPGEAR